MMPLFSTPPQDESSPLGLQGAAQMAQPLVAPPMAPVVSPAALSSMYGARDSVLSTDPRQERLGQLYDKVINDAYEGGSASSRGEMIGTKIFGGIVAPIIAGFGGAGAQRAGADMLQEANNQVNQIKMQRRADQQNAMQSLKSITDIVSITSPFSSKNKKMAADVQLRGDKNAIDAANSATRRFSAFSRDEHLKRADAAASGRLEETTRHNQQTEALRRAGIQVDLLKSQQVNELERAKFSLSKQIATMSQDLQRDKFNLDKQTKLQELIYKYRTYNQTQANLVNKWNEEMRMKAARVDPKSGEFIFQGKDGQEFSLSPLSTGDSTLEADLGGLLDQDAEALSAADLITKQVMTPQGQTPPAQLMQQLSQPPAPPGPAMPQTASAGSGLSGALMKFTSRIRNMNAQQVEIERQRFIRDSGGIDPFKQLSANGK